MPAVAKRIPSSSCGHMKKVGVKFGLGDAAVFVPTKMEE